MGKRDSASGKVTEDGEAETGLAKKSASRSDTAEPDVVGPPIPLLAAALASLLVSILLVPSDGIALHVVGYATGALVPILLVGLIRRVDLDRRRSAHYLASPLVQPGQAVVLVGSLVVALLHMWPIATELAR